jgi:hydrogenase expression/formation protein HypD
VKHIDEFRDAALVRSVAARIAALTTKPWVVMEICGGQTNAIVRYGLDELLPPAITLVHGPGCPVCVTPVALIDTAIAIAALPDVILCSFGDMLRVPGTERDLLSVKAAGGDVRIVYSPMDALELARRFPGKEVVFFAVGFETTAPANAMALWQARRDGVRNFSSIVSQVLVPPAMKAILDSPASTIQGFLAAGHVCTVMGFGEYEELAERYRVPIVVTGFEPLDLMQGVLMCVRQLEEGRAEVENQYARSVRREGNQKAQEIMREVFQVVSRTWRGIGEIPMSGLGLRDEYAAFDAERRFGVHVTSAERSDICISGEILRGLKKPPDCRAFAGSCTPSHPLGATMVSAEGACSVYYAYKKFNA